MFVVGVAEAWASGLLFVLALLSPGFLIGFAGCAALVVGLGLREASRACSLGERLIAAFGPPILLGVTIVAAFPALWAGRFTGILIQFDAERSAYDEIVVSLQNKRAAATQARQQHDDIVYVIDSGPPLRVAFHPEGILDNWSGIVFDPSGAVMQAEGFHPDTGAVIRRPGVTELFGGDLTRCRPLAQHYYYCSFT